MKRRDPTLAHALWIIEKSQLSKWPEEGFWQAVAVLKKEIGSHEEDECPICSGDVPSDGSVQQWKQKWRRKPRSQR